MRIAVADDLQVKVVGGPTAGEHCVQLLSGLLPGREAVNGVSGDALGGMDGGGIARLVEVRTKSIGSRTVSWLWLCRDREVTAPAYAGDGPPVTVLDPVGRGESESAVVGPGDDHISDTGPVPVGQRHLGYCRGVIEPMRTGTSVQFGRPGPGWGRS
jgi:hypothetical protein